MQNNDIKININKMRNSGFTRTPIPVHTGSSISDDNRKNLNTYKDANVGIGVSLHSKRGFTLIETVVFISVFTLVMIILVSSIIFFYRANAYSVEQSFAVNSARKGIELLVRDIREVTYSDEGAYPLIDGADNNISFYSDIDRDNNVERVRYFLEDGSLKKGVTKSSGNPLSYDLGTEIVSIISPDIRNDEQSVSIFRYYNDTGGEIFNVGVNITDISFVTVNLIVNINPNRLPNEFTLQSSATLRNVKTNL